MQHNTSNTSINNFEECIKCTICTAYCPVTAVNPLYPGPKQAGPDVERYRLKKPSFYDEALKYCLNCKRCEVACPSNVRIGDIIQSARMRYSTNKPNLRDRLLANTDFVGSMNTVIAPIVNPLLSASPVKKIMEATLGIDSHRQFPAYSSQRFTSWYKKIKAKQTAYPNYVAYFHGCYVEYNFPQLGKDLIKILNAIGYGVLLLDQERCCGVAKIANGLIKEARKDAQTNIDAIRRAARSVISTSSTCVFTMRDEYPHLLDINNSDVRDNIQLATRYIYNLIESNNIKLVFKKDYKRKLAYHTPCHLSKLGWWIYSVSLMKMIPGIELTVLPQQCCGIAGTYGFKKENYKYSQEIGKHLFDSIRMANPDAVATDCETCKWQIEMSTDYNVHNPISIIADALDVNATMQANNILQ